MRIATANQQLDVEPGSTTSVIVDIVNTGDVIDGVSARVIGLSDEFVHAQPALLPLFPDTGGQVTLALSIPKTHPAGRHPITVEMTSHGAMSPSQYLDVDLDVAAHPGLKVAAAPQLVRARRSARFVLEITNEGNVALDIVLQAVDVERTVTATFVPSTLRIEPGSVSAVLLDIRGPRMFTGSDIERSVSVEVVGEQPRGSHEAGPSPDAQRRQITVRLRQRPLIGRGVLTALILAGIVLLWAAVFLLGLSKVFGGDPATKAAPASFFAASGNAGTTQAAGAGGPGAGAANSGGGAGGSAAGGGAAATAPADALPKTGQLPPGIGGQISGQVRASTSGQAVPRILVQAWRQSTRNGRTSLIVVSSAATQSDGTYTLAGLFPTTYYLQFSNTGYRTVWYPSVPTQKASTPIEAVAQGSATDVNATITGKPASITGTVDPGDTVNPPPTSVEAFPLSSASGTAITKKPAASAMTDTKGNYTLTGLKAPASYQLTFRTAGYQTSTLVESIGGGEQRVEPAVVLGASTGTISGVVSSDDVGLGGATVTTTVNGKALSIVTPTTGQVGAYSLTNLPTPATYVITFSAPGHGRRTTIVDLSAGASRPRLDVALLSGTGTITGHVVTGAKNTPLGGVTVTVGGTSGSDITTTTLTDGDVGGFLLSGLGASGSYTLTFTRDGYSPATVPISLPADSGRDLLVPLSSGVGSISGVVTYRGDGYVGATVTATNGSVSRTTTTSSRSGSDPSGSYLITGLAPGTYSVTVTADGRRQQTRIVSVDAAQTTPRQNLELGG